MDVDAGNRFAGGLRFRGPVIALLFLVAGGIAFISVTSPAGAAGPYLIDASTISAGYGQTCAIRKADPADAAGQVVCWGKNGFGELGDGTTTDSDTPVAVKQVGWTGTAPNDGLLDDAIAIATGFQHSCAIRSGGQTVCWGNDDDGRLGDGSFTGSSVPVAVKQVGWTGTAPDDGLLNDAIRITAGTWHTCAIRTGGQAVCWGWNASGQLGDGSAALSSVPVAVKEPGWTGTAPDDGLLDDAIAIAAGQYHTCSIRTGGQAVCWGYNGYGQLGDATGADSTVPVAVKQAGFTGTAPDDGLLTDAATIAAGSLHNCAILTGGKTVCWGVNSYGQLGNGTTLGGQVPVEVKQVGWTGSAPDNGLLDDAIEVTAGSQHSCAILADGQAACWGQNGEGQLGDGTAAPSNVPVAVKQVGWTGIAPDDGLLTGAATIAAGYWHSCAIRSGGEAVCWGDNGDGQLGDGTSPDTGVPVRVLRGTAALRYSLALTRSGTGEGRVTSSPAEIDCGAICQADFDEDAEVTLTASADPGSTFTGWTGACTGTDPVCTVTMDEAKTVAAGFIEDAPGPPACPAVKLGFTLKGFKPTPPFGNSAKTSGLRARIKTGRNVVMRIRPVIRYRLAGKKRSARLKTRTIRVNVNRNLRFRIPKKMRRQFRRAGERLPGARVTLQVRATLRLRGTSADCLQSADGRKIRTRVVQVSDRAAISRA